MTWLVSLVAAALAAQPVPEPPPVPAPQDAAPLADTAAQSSSTAEAPSDSGTRVVRGTPAAPGSARWQVQIYAATKLTDADLEKDRRLPDTDRSKNFYDRMTKEMRDHKCGGALISADWVLTAAHCFVDPQGALRPLPARRVRLGNNDLAAGTTLAIDRVIVHADYDHLGAKRHDIALIHLRADRATDPAKRAAAATVPLAPADMRALRAGDVLRVTGWGVTAENESGKGRDRFGNALLGSYKLLEGFLRPADPDRCRAIGPLAATVWDGVICAVGDERGQDACQGDSGGPLTWRGQLVGVVSTGSGCGVANVPAIYTRVPTYVSWINAVMAGARTPGMNTRCGLAPGSNRLVCQAAAAARPRAAARRS